MSHLPEVFLILILALRASSNQRIYVKNEFQNSSINSLYVWDADTLDKGANILCTGALTSGQSVSIPQPEHSINLLAFDDVGNSYSLRGFSPAGPGDTIRIGLKILDLSTPNLDHGRCPVNIINSLAGLDLDSIRAWPCPTGDTLSVATVALYNGRNSILWLDPGLWTIRAYDELGDSYGIDSIHVSSAEEAVVHIRHQEDLSKPYQKSERTAGNVVFIIVNNIPDREICSAEAVRQADRLTMEFLSNSVLRPGESLVCRIDPGEYTLHATDDLGGSYTLWMPVEQDTTVIHIDTSALDFDFGFPAPPANGS
jgi:hypothetical protein